MSCLQEGTTVLPGGRGEEGGGIADIVLTIVVEWATKPKQCLHKVTG